MAAASPTPITYFSGNTTVGTTPTSLYSLILSYFVANRSGDLNTDGKLYFSAYRLINLFVISGTLQYGDQTTTTTVGLPVAASSSKYEQDYTGRPSIDITQRFLCATTGTVSFAFECWR